MARPEKKVKERLRRALPDLFSLHMIELRTGEVGFPDMMYFGPDRKCGFIEAKWIYSYSNPLNRWEVPQRTWVKKRIAMGFPCFLLIGDDLNTWLLNAALHLESDVILDSVGKWGKSINKLELQNILTK